MDISKLTDELAREETAIELPIFQKNGDPYKGEDGEQATISVTGSDSKAVRAAERANTRRAINRSARAKLTPEQLHEARVILAASAVTTWSGWTDGNEPFPCTNENVRKMLMMAPHILRQVEEGVLAHSDFFAEQSPD